MLRPPDMTDKSVGCSLRKKTSTPLTSTPLKRKRSSSVSEAEEMSDSSDTTFEISAVETNDDDDVDNGR